MTVSHFLESIIEQAEQFNGVLKADLRRGDRVLVTTKNSIYAICYLGDNLYSVSGGWFDREGLAPARITINGCTWGGSVINIDIVAARGLFLEFGNGVLTTRIQQVQVLRSNGAPSRLKKNRLLMTWSTSKRMTEDS